MKVIGFDLEQYSSDWSGGASVELPVSCAVTTLSASADGGSLPSWAWVSMDGIKATPTMSTQRLNLLIDQLATYTLKGLPVLTWHGAAYDLPCLAHHSGRTDLLRQIALQSIDLHLLFMSISRHRLSLKAAAEAVGSHKGGGEVESGSEALSLWPERWHDVLAYCMQDVQATLDVFTHLCKYREFTWPTKKGRTVLFKLPTELQRPQTWTVHYLLNEFAWRPAPVWVTDPSSANDLALDWLKDGG